MIYLGIIAGTAYAVYWYVLNMLPSGLQFSGRISVLVLALHGSVLIAGVAILFSLRVPMFPSKVKERSGRLVTLRDAPLLHSFVGRIADSLGVPVPSEIRLTCDVDTSASYRGPGGLFRKHRVLSMGESVIRGRGLSYFGASAVRSDGMENFAAEVVAAADEKADKSGKTIEKQLQTSTSWFDSPPGISDRIAAVRTEHRPGIFSPHGPGLAAVSEVQSQCAVTSMKVFLPCSHRRTDKPPFRFTRISDWPMRRGHRGRERACHKYAASPFIK